MGKTNNSNVSVLTIENNRFSAGDNVSNKNLLVALFVIGMTVWVFSGELTNNTVTADETTAAVRAAEEARQRRSVSSAGDLDRAEREAMDELLARDASVPSRAIGGRLFRLPDGVWTDIAHREARAVTRIKAFSAAYFEVLSALPEIAPVLRELSDVVIAGADSSVQIGADGLEEVSASLLKELVADFRGADGA